MKIQMKGLSLVIPVFNEEQSIQALVVAIAKAMQGSGYKYEMIFVDDNSTDNTRKILQELSDYYPLLLLTKKGKKGKVYFLFEEFNKATFDILGMIDADLQYPPDAIPSMLLKIKQGEDIVVANRAYQGGSKIRKTASKVFKNIFAKSLFGISHDVQAGLKVFRKEVWQTVIFTPRSGWTFDLEFLYRARQAGYRIQDVETFFAKRPYGKSKVRFLKTTFELMSNALQVKSKRLKPLHISPMNGESMQGSGIGYKRKQYITHTTLHHSQSAIQTFLLRQKLFFAFLIGAWLAVLIFHPLLTLQITIAILSAIYFLDVIFNLFIVLQSLHKSQEITSTQDELEAIDESKLPLYSILCPLYKEAHVIPQFMKAISALDYPKGKLDVMLLLEEDDTATQDAVKKMGLPSHVRAIVVPHSMPKTKPKACNYGLQHAKGEFVVIYDAEDMPDPLQLKKAFLGFQKVERNVICLQAKLNYYNPQQNLLTRFFTTEYSLWFDITLTGLQALGTSIPLGGTSNHFRTADLIALEGWDAFNVTEDADLGIRLFKKGYKTAVIDSTTLEEANSKVGNWFRQRSRWIKGYMQTYLVHTRRQSELTKSHGIIHNLYFHMNVGGKLAFILINPILWITTIAYFAFRPIIGPTIESLYPGPILYIAILSLVFGNFLFLYYCMIACAKKGQWDLIKYIYLIPLYWLVMSGAALIALQQLIFKPHYWEKTVHGLHLKKTQNKKAFTEAIIEAEELQSGFSFPFPLRRQLTKLINLKNLYLAGGFLVIAASIANFLNFLFNAYLGRNLSFEDFALVSFVGGILAVSQTVFGSLSITVNFKSGFLIGTYGEYAGYTFWKSTVRKIVVISIIATLFWLLLSPVLNNYFRVNDMAVLIISTAIIFFGFISAVNRGYLSGKLLFISIAFMNLVEPIAKLATSFILINAHQQKFVFTAVVVGSFSVFLVGLFLVMLKGKPKTKEEIAGETKQFPLKFFIASLVSSISAVLFLTMDIIIAKHYLSPHDAGRYALISLIGKMVYFMGGLVSPFLIPLVSRNEGANKNSQKTLIAILALTFVLTCIGFVSFGIFGGLTVPFLYGKKALEIVSYLPLYTFAMMCFTVGAVFGSYYLAKKVYTFSFVAFAIGLIELLLLSIFHQNISIFVMTMSGIWMLYLFSVTLLHLNIQSVKAFERNIRDFFGLFKKDKFSKDKENKHLSVLIFNWRDTKHMWAGGAETYIHEIAKEWVKNGAQVTLFSGNDGKHQRNQIIDGVQVVRRGGFYMVYFWAFLYYIVQIRGIYDDIIDSENGIPFFTPLYARKPIFLLIHHVHQEVFREQLIFPFSLLARLLESKVMPFVYRNAHIVTVSESSKKQIIKLGLSTESEIQVINPGIEIGNFIRVKKTKNPSFIYLGRLKPYKNVDIAIKAFNKVVKKYPAAKLTIAGFGECLEKLQKLTKNLGIQQDVMFLGTVSEKDKKLLLAKHWAFLQPSMIEGWGITVIEANASGTPVIASDVSGLRDSVLGKKTGILVTPKDIDEFSEAMVRIITKERQTKLLSIHAIEWSKNFSWDKSATEYMKLFNKVQQQIESKRVQIFAFAK